MTITRIASLLFLVGESACIQSAPAAEETQAIVGGTLTTGDPGVVMLVASTNGGEAWCTAEIVSPHVVMTAAHCVSPAEVGQVNRFDVFIGSDINDNQQAGDQSLWLTVSETHYNPAFDSLKLDSGQDVAVVILTDATPIKPLALNRTALTQPMMGQMVRIVGYGVTDGSQQQGSGTKRQAQTPLSDFDTNFIIFGTAQKGTCQGDSGGPAFMTINGAEVIAGITSFGDQGCTSGGYDTRVDTVAAAFVDPFIAQLDPPPPAPPLSHAGDPSYPAPATAAPLPGSAGNPGDPSMPNGAATGCTIAGHSSPPLLPLLLLLALVTGRRWRGGRDRG